jgi:hypothetical protein
VCKAALAVLTGAVWLAALPVAAQPRREFVGPGKCTDCHDHKDEKEWSEKRDGDGKGKQHLNALNQLSDAKAETYAKAVGVADIYDVKSSCVRCHATVVRGSADFGVSCESCHGAGKDYLKPHQEKGAYQASIALGLNDTIKKPEAWLKICVSCHVLGDDPGDAALIKAGHASGADFDFGVKFQPVASHWTSKYTANQIAAIGNPLRNAIARTAAATPPAALTAAAAAPTPAAAPPAPVSPPTAPAAAPSVTRAAGSRGSPPPPPALPPALPPPPAPVIATVIDAPASPSPASLVSALHGRIAQLLSDLLSRGVRAPVAPPASATKVPYRGADAELLRLQEEVIALALEALATAPPVKTPPPPK